MFSKIPEPPQIFLVMTEDGDVSVGAFLDEPSAQSVADKANEGHAGFEPYFVNEVEVHAQDHQWRDRCPVCQAREAFYRRTQDDGK